MQQRRKQPKRQVLKGKLAKQTSADYDLPAVLLESERACPPLREVVRGPEAFRAMVATRRDRVWHAAWSGLAHELAVFVAWASIAESAATLRKAVQLPTPREVENLARIFSAWALSCHLDCNDTMEELAAPRSMNFVSPQTAEILRRTGFKGQHWQQGFQLPSGTVVVWHKVLTCPWGIFMAS
eukprot:CAMPEP_0172919196 /NCGR_PEP_ID=MMETSP1075-20121228/201650_1 /TAXON_ID=2916 /ORGANISM="Ceratium fusus, Strain PA161109" /LENGTH=182 /DNA_ID=CAMNT_0013778981 /DNA_START=256 /DNA_END=805 /DNA_ORIENTATION=-